jgi:hypothetical protein
MLTAILLAQAVVSLKIEMKLLFLGCPMLDPMFLPHLSDQQHPWHPPVTSFSPLQTGSVQVLLFLPGLLLLLLVLLHKHKLLLPLQLLLEEVLWVVRLLQLWVVSLFVKVLLPQVGYLLVKVLLLHLKVQQLQVTGEVYPI